MRARTITLALAIITMGLGSSASADPATPHKPGEIVCAKWNADWYLGTIIGTTDGKWAVLYADGDKGMLDDDQIKTIPWNPSLAVGDKVLAAWEGKPKFFTGTVLEVCAMSYKVKWDDGSAPSWVPATRILKDESKI